MQISLLVIIQTIPLDLELRMHLMDRKRAVKKMYYVQRATRNNCLIMKYLVCKKPNELKLIFSEFY